MRTSKVLRNYRHNTVILTAEADTQSCAVTVRHSVTVASAGAAAGRGGARYWSDAMSPDRCTRQRPSDRASERAPVITVARRASCGVRPPDSVTAAIVRPTGPIIGRQARTGSIQHVLGATRRGRAHCRLDSTTLGRRTTPRRRGSHPPADQPNDRPRANYPPSLSASCPSAAAVAITSRAT